MSDGALTLEAVFGSAPQRAELRVAYVLRNAGPGRVAVFDRGDRQQVLGGRLIAGAVPPPRVEGDVDGAVLVHAAQPLPQPPPTLPPTPLAACLEAGATLHGAFVFAPMGPPPRRLRWCLGVVDFDDADFDLPQRIDGLSLWRASFAVVDRQRRLCTPWFDPATGDFAG